MIKEADFTAVGKNAFKTFGFILVIVTAIEVLIIAILIFKFIRTIDVQKVAAFVSTPIEVFAGVGLDFVPGVKSLLPSRVFQQSQRKS